MFLSQFPRRSTRPGARLQGGCHIRLLNRLMTFQHGLNQPGNIEESNFARKEKSNSLLIGPNKGTGIGPASFPCLDSQTEAGEACYVKRLKVQRSNISPAQLTN